MNELSNDELARCEQIISAGLETFVEVGLALETIREKELYKARGFDNFSAYCEKVFGLKLSNATRKIVGARVSSQLTLVNGKKLANEQAARELARVPAEMQQSVYAVAAKNVQTETISAGQIKAAYSVLQIGVATGYAETEEGTLTPIDAAFGLEMEETHKRRLQHIADHSRPPLLDIEVTSPKLAQNRLSFEVSDVSTAQAFIEALEGQNSLVRLIVRRNL